MIPICAPHRTLSSAAFLKSPVRRFENVTCLLLSSLICLISIFCLPLVVLGFCWSFSSLSGKQAVDERSPYSMARSNDERGDHKNIELTLVTKIKDFFKEKNTPTFIYI